MDIAGFKAFVENNFADKDLIVVSNREPYVHRRSSSGIEVNTPAGGLNSAMDDVLRAIGGTWVAWGSGNADREVVDTGDLVRVPPDNPKYTLKRVWLTKAQVENYYHGYSNRVLWPLCHIVLDKVYFRKKYWRDYLRVNHAFADSVLEEAKEGSIVWIHDYHLCVAPRLLREARPDLTLVHFWHIPWPSWGVMRICPHATEIITSLLGNDLIGFQTELFVRNFMDCVGEVLADEDVELDYKSGVIRWRGRTIHARAFPISIDYDRFDAAARSGRTEEMVRKVRDEFKLGGRIGVGVDRLEYTKGLLKRLQALEIFFEKYRKYRGEFTFVQVAPPTRGQEPYISYHKAVQSLVDRINDRYATGDWMPVVFLDKKVDFEDMVVYFRISDFAIISSIYDGMNLVAKEYAASQVDEKGVLILSELTGAADEFTGAIMVNPYDVEGFADAIKQALEMPAKERSARMSLMRGQVREFDIYRWIYDIISEILKVSAMKEKQDYYLFDHIDEVAGRLASSERPFVFLDYDGTLTPIVETPDKALITEEAKGLLGELAGKIPVAIISGRSLEDVREKVGIDGLIYAGNHGAEIWDGEKELSQNLSVDTCKLQELLDRLKAELGHIEGVFIEDKRVTASIHFRKVRTRDVAEVFDTFQRIASDYEDSFRITSGKKVLEIRPLDVWNKGDAVEWIAGEKGADGPLVYVGDDTTDEDAYRAVKGRGISISVGPNPVADYYLKGQGEVPTLLKDLAERLGSQKAWA